MATATSTDAALEPWVTLTPKTLVLTLLNTQLPLASYATSTNGAAVGGALDRLRARATGDLANVTRELTALDDAGLGRALDAVSGEIHASAVQLAALDGEAATDLIREEMASRGRLEGAQAVPAWSWGADGRAWARFQSQSTTFASGLAHGGEARISGFAVGADWTQADRWLVGIGAAYTKGHLALNRLEESSDYTAPRAFGYVAYSRRWIAHLGASLAWGTYDVRRTFDFTARLPEAFGGGPLLGGVSRGATSTSPGLATDLWGDWALPMCFGGWAVRPGAGLRYGRYARHGWTESGPDALSLSASDQVIPSAQTDMGLHVDRVTGRFRLNASAAYRRELTSGRTAAALHLADNADGLFLINGLPLTRDNLTTRLGFTFQADRVDMSLAYEGQEAAGQVRHAIRFGVGF